MKIKTCPVQIKAAGEQDGTEAGEFEAIVATYDLDSYGDKIVPGAFADTIAEWKSSGNPMPVLWSHMSHDPDYHIGWVKEAKETDQGLWVRGQLDIDDPASKAAKVYKLLKGRRVTQFSFAFDVQDGAEVTKAAEGEQPEQRYYELRKLKVYEVGPCLVGVNQNTDLIGVKAPQPTVEVPGDPRPIQKADPMAYKAPLIDPMVFAELVDGFKSGRVLSQKNENALRGALESISKGITDVESVLAGLEANDTEKASSASETKTEDSEASRTPQETAPPEEGPASTPAKSRTAGRRLLMDLDLLEIESDTDE